jgi:hypothetical protein
MMIAYYVADRIALQLDDDRILRRRQDFLVVTTALQLDDDR